jgi:hypothetical protein
MSSSSASMFAIAPIPFPVGKTTRGDGAPDAGETESNDGLERLKTLGCERLRVAGTPGSLYERHLIFDKAIAPSKASARDRFDAFAQAVRDVVNARWLATDETYEQDNPKRIYYLSMEFLIGRSLANNVTNLLAEGIADRAAREESLEWLALIEEEPRVAMESRKQEARRPSPPLGPTISITCAPKRSAEKVQAS